jgi:hypothetical protein
MRRSGSRSRPVTVLLLLAFSSATLATTSARADLSFPMADTFVGSGPAAPAAATPSPITPLVSTAAPSQPIELREVFWGDRYGQVRHGPFPFQGGKPLDGADLYRALGRDDLVRAYESRVDAKVALAITALGALATGAIVLKGATPETQCETPPPRYAFQAPVAPVCQTDWKKGTVAAGIGIMLSGLTLFFVSGLGFGADPVSPAERLRLIDSFNASLAHATADGAPTRAKSATTHFTASPTLSGSSAGLTVNARF